jgi:triosephosphate isomerase
MHKTRAEAIAFVHAFKKLSFALSHTDLAIAPSFPLLETISRELHHSSIKLAAQNMHFAKEGAFTGEVSPHLLYEFGVSYVILGHSERRGHFRETDQLINQKMHAAFDFDLTPIMCVGETLQKRQQGQRETERVLERQLGTGLKDLTPNSVGSLVIAYEPVWAIGTGINASPADAELGAEFIRRCVERSFDKDAAVSVRILYGGSVKPENATELLEQPNIDGALVGGASLDPGAFAAIAQATRCRDQ